MKTVFADSFYFFALVNDRDPAHAKSLAFLRTYSGRLLTTAWVLTELGDGLTQPANRPAFLQTLRTLQNDPNVVIVAFEEALFEAGVALFSQRRDKTWSLTDCISFVVMQREGITDALTGDHHFEQAGFRALFK